MPYQSSSDFTYSAVSAVLETVAEVEARIERYVKLACENLGCEHRHTASLFGTHSIFDQPLGGADWNREVSLIRGGNETQFVFDLNVDHNTRETEVRGILNFQGTYGYDTLREYCVSVVDIAALKQDAITVVDNMFSQLEADFDESRTRTEAAPKKGCTRSTYSGGCEVVRYLFVPGEPRRYQ